MNSFPHQEKTTHRGSMNMSTRKVTKKKHLNEEAIRKKEFMVNLKSFEGIFFWQCESDVENSYLIFLHFQSFTIFFPFLTRNFFFF